MTTEPRARRLGRARRGALVALLVGGGLAATVAGATAASADSPFARAILTDATGQPVGRVRFYRSGDHTTVRVRLAANANVTPERFHGFHLHAGSDPATGASGCVADPAQPASTWFVSAGGHLKADGTTHGDHIGDLPSLQVNADGTASAEFETDRFTLDQLRGRAVVLHAGPDNFGNVPVGTAPEQYTPNSPAAVMRTQNTGNAGDRVACGVVKGGRSGDRD